MSDKWEVIGECEVAGVAPGGIVTREQLEAWGDVNIGVLIGVHLQPVAGEPKPVKKAEKG